jgi:hypothetical protein
MDAALLLPGDRRGRAAEIRSVLDLLEARAQFDGPDWQSWQLPSKMAK